MKNEEVIFTPEQVKKLEEFVKHIPAKVSLDCTNVKLMDVNSNIFNLGTPKDFSMEYICKWKGEDNMKERINKFFEENEIKVDENGNFEMYVVVNANDKDHEVGALICGKEVKIYTKERAYDDLKVNNSGGFFDYLAHSYFIFKTKPKERISIKEDLLTMKDKIYKISVNKENIQEVELDKLVINKYKVLEEEILRPVLKYKILEVNEESIRIKLYNNLTENFRIIVLDNCDCIPDKSELSEMIIEYLSKDIEATNLQNVVNENGIELN